jgi:signal transduction histidine kinase
MEAMNDIVWMINPKNDRFENIMVRMRTHAAEIIEAAGSDLHISFDEKLAGIKLTMEQRKNFYLIFKEAVNNIVKYAKAKDVWIGMRMNNRQIELMIRDNGTGFDAVRPGHGNGLVNMKQRAELLNGNLRIESQRREGTTITLDFTA